MMIIEEYSRISQLLPNYIRYKFTDTSKSLSERFVVFEVVKLGFWK